MNISSPLSHVCPLTGAHIFNVLMKKSKVDAAMQECEKQAVEFHIIGYRLLKNFGGIKGNTVLEGYGENNYAVYAKL